MKQYFAKYLPVEGEIKEGDTFSFKKKVYRANSVEGSKKNPEEWWIDFERNKNVTCINHSDAQKVKLFLCSRDIQVGDEIKAYIGSQLCSGKVADIQGDEVIPESISLRGARIPKKGCFKVIGEISPDATWVKEEQGFDEDDWKLLMPDPSWQFQVIKLDKKWVGKQPTSYIAIKGPCGHFH